MNLIKRTDMNSHKQSQKMVFSLVGISFFLITAFPQTLWASGGDRDGLNRFLEVLELVLSDRSGVSHRNSSRDGYYYRGNDRHREYRPVANRYYREDRRPTYYEDSRTSRYYQKHSRRHRYPKHKHCNKNRHRHSHHNYNSWR